MLKGASVVAMCISQAVFPPFYSRYVYSFIDIPRGLDMVLIATSFQDDTNQAIN